MSSANCRPVAILRHLQSPRVKLMVPLSRRPRASALSQGLEGRRGLGSPLREGVQISE